MIANERNSSECLYLLSDFFLVTTLSIRAKAVPDSDSWRMLSQLDEIKLFSFKHFMTDFNDMTLACNRLLFCCEAVSFFFNKSSFVQA